MDLFVSRRRERGYEDFALKFWLIDPPVTPYSDTDKILDWIRELESMPDSAQKTEAIDQAKAWLAISDSQEKQVHPG